MIPQHLASINEFSSWFVSMSSIPIEALALIGSFNPLLNEFGLSCRRFAAKVTETILWSCFQEMQFPASLQKLSFGQFFNQSLQGVNLAAYLQELTFALNYHQSLQGVNLPASLQTLTFGFGFDNSLQEVNLPAALQTPAFGNRFNGSQGVQIILKESRKKTIDI